MASASTSCANRARRWGRPALLEVPAGKLDVEGESPLECAQRELVEEIGMRASQWTEIKRFYTSPGFAEEEVTAVRGHRPRRSRRPPNPIPTSGSRSSRGRSPTSTARSTPAPTPRASSPCCCSGGCAADFGARRRGCTGRGVPGRAKNAGDMAIAVPPETGAATARFEALVLDFLAYLEFERGLARNTLDAYRTDLLQFGAFLRIRERDATEASRAPTSRTSSPTSRPARRRTRRATAAGPPARRRPSTARPPACAPSTATCAARS